MRVLKSLPDRRKGMIIANPRRLPTILQESSRGMAAAVLHEDDLVINTTPLECHQTTAAAAGIELVEGDLPAPAASCSLHMLIEKDLVIVEFWRPDEDEPGEPEIDHAAFRALLDRVTTHPALKNAFGTEEFRVEIAILCNGAGSEWIFDASGLRPLEMEEPLPMCAAM